MSRFGAIFRSASDSHGSFICRFTVAIALSVTAVGAGYAAAVSGNLEPIGERFLPLANDTARYYVGESITITVTNQIDSNHVFHHYTYSCGFLGLGTCDGQESTPHWVGLNVLPIDVRLIAGDGSLPATPAHNTATRDPQTQTTVAVVSLGSSPYVASIASPGSDFAAIARGYELQMRVSDRLNNVAGTLSRTSCAGPPTEAVCSQSYYSVSIDSVDVSKRLPLIQNLLKNGRFSVAQITSDNLMDKFIREQKGRDDAGRFPGRIGPAELAAQMIADYVDKENKAGGASAYSSQEQEEIFRFVIDKLDDRTPTIRNRLTSLWIRNGDITRAKLRADDDLKVAREYYDQSKNAATPDAKAICGLGSALSNSAQVSLRDRVALQSSDLAIASDLLNQAGEVYQSAKSVECGDGDTALTRLRQAKIDQARVLSLVRTPQLLEMAAAALVEARALLPPDPQNEDAPSAHKIVPDRALANERSDTVPGVPTRNQNTEFNKLAYSRVNAPESAGLPISVARVSANAEVILVAPSAVASSTWEVWSSTKRNSIQLGAKDPARRACAPQVASPLGIVTEGTGFGLLLLSGDVSTGGLSVLSLNQQSCAVVIDKMSVKPALLGLGDSMLVLEQDKGHRVGDGFESRYKGRRLETSSGKVLEEWTISQTEGTETRVLSFRPTQGSILAGAFAVGDAVALAQVDLAAAEPKWVTVCTEGIPPPSIVQLAISEDGRALAIIDANGVLFYARNAGDVARGCDVSHANLADFAVNAHSARLRPYGPLGFITYEERSTDPTTSDRVVLVMGIKPKNTTIAAGGAAAVFSRGVLMSVGSGAIDVRNDPDSGLIVATKGGPSGT